MHERIGKSGQRTGAYWYLAIVCVFLVMRLFFWFSPSHADKINMLYLWPLAIAAAVLVVAQRRALPGWRYMLPPAMAAWLWVCCVFNGDAYLIYNRIFILGIFLSFVSFFLVIPSLPQAQREQGLWWLAVIYCVLMLVVAVLGLVVAFTERPFLTALSDELIYIRGNRLFFFRYHPNEAGSALVVALSLALYLLASLRRAIARALLILAGGILCLTIALTGSRSAIILAAAGVGFLVFGAIYTYAFHSHAWLRWPVGLAAFVAIVAGCIWGSTHRSV